MKKPKRKFLIERIDDELGMKMTPRKREFMRLMNPEFTEWFRKICEPKKNNRTNK